MLPARLDSHEMPLPDDLRMRVAGEPDLPSIVALRESVEWAVHDWALRAVIEPPEARCLVVVDARDEICGVGSGMSYGALGWVGNMIVAAEQRRRGVGTAILDGIRAFLDERGCTRLELFATESGRPLYARHGFALTAPMLRAMLPRSTPLKVDPSVEIAEGGDLEELVAYDTPRFGGDRRRLLGMMANDAERPLLVARRGGTIAGFAWLRPDGARLGPVLADTPAEAASLVAEAFRRVPQIERFGLNLPSGNSTGTRWLRGLGIEELEAWEGHMAHGPQVPRREETMYGHLVGALG